MGWPMLFGTLLIADGVWPGGLLAGVVGFCLAFAGLTAVILWVSMGAAAGEARWPSALLIALSGLALTAIVAWLQPHAALGGLLAGAGLLAFGGWLGARLGAEMQQPGHLWPIAVVAAAADLWSVTSPEGLTHQLVVEADSASRVVDLIVLSLPVPGIGVTPVLGVGDVLFTAFLIAACRRVGFDTRRTLVGLALGFAICLGALVVWQLPLPALPFIGIMVALSAGRQAIPSARDGLATLVFVAALFGARFAIG